MKARIEWMDTLRGALIIAVILFHSVNRIQRYDEGALAGIAAFNASLDPVRMPALVMLSGVLLSRSLAKPTRQYLSGKARTLAWPYVVWVLISITLLWLPGATDDPSVVPSLYAQALIGHGTYMWFLWFLFGFYMLSLAIPARLHPWLIVPSLIVAQLLSFNAHWSSYFYLLAFFWVGSIARSMLTNARLWMSAIGILCLVAVGAATVAGMGVKFVPLLAPLVVAAVFGLAGLAKLIENTAPGRMLAGIGRSTITYYVTHYVTIMVAYFAASRFLNVANPWLLFAICVTASLVVGYLTARLKDHPAVGWLFVFPHRKRALQPA